MRMKKFKFLISVLVFFLFAGNAVAVPLESIIIEPVVLEKLNKTYEVEVIVLLKEANISHAPGKVAGITEVKLNKKQILEQRKSIISAWQNKVLSTLMVSSRDDGEIVSNNSDIDFRIKHRYKTVNAFSGKLTKQGLEKLKNNNDIKGIFFDKKMYASLDRSIPLINADDVWIKQVNGKNITGLKESVCVIDTGVDYTHEYLGAGWGNKIIGGYDFVNGDSDPMDDNGHGTHVAGIIASTDETYRGVAPDANIVAVKALGSNGKGDDSDVIAGIDWCVDNADLFNISVISMSLGDEIQYSAYCNDEPAADAINAAFGHGIFVVAASGNEYYINGISSPACVENATSVGASDSTALGAELSVISDGNNKLDSHPLEYSALAADLTGELLYADLGYPENFTGQNFTGKIALIKRGILYFYEKVQNAYDAGAAGVVIYNNLPGNFYGTLINTSEIPAVSISRGDGNYLLDLLENETVEVNITVALNEGMAALTNRNEILDLLAPGIDIYSTKLNGGFESNGGTSMAAPHVSGAAVLLIQYQREHNKSLTPYRIEDILKDTGKNIYDPQTGLTFPGIDILAAINSIDVTPPGITLQNPKDNNISTTGNVTFRYIVNDTSSGIANCSLIINDILNQTDSTITKGTTQEFTESIIIGGTYTWNIKCTDNSMNTNIGSGIARTLNVSCPYRYYRDLDNDSYGNLTNNTSICITTAPPGYVSDNTDCNDNNVSINPGAGEIYNRIDDDCNGLTDDGFCDTNNNCSFNRFCNASIHLCRDLNCSIYSVPFNHQCPLFCDLNHDGIHVRDYNDLMTAYKCFLGIENNCNIIKYQEWNLIKKEYQCFVNLKNVEWLNF